VVAIRVSINPDFVKVNQSFFDAPVENLAWALHGTGRFSRRMRSMTVNSGG
jgi:hypothetical protein